MENQASYLTGECPQYLRAPELGLTTLKACNLIDEAVERYSEPWRMHHTVEHLTDVINFLMENVGELENPRRTLWAAIDHDIVYVPQAVIPGTNEQLSALLNQRRLAGLLPAGEVCSAGQFIRATADHQWDGEDSDLAYLLDADLKILGAPEEEFYQYDGNIRREYWFVESEDYDEARQRILQGFYDQDRLFITDVAHDRFEDQAKANLERRLNQFKLLSADFQSGLPLDDSL